METITLSIDGFDNQVESKKERGRDGEASSFC